MSASESLMPGPEGKTPRFYEVDRGQKTESYINAVSGNPVVPPEVAPVEKKKPAKYSKIDDSVTVDPFSYPSKNGLIGLTAEELAEYKDHRSWRFLRLFLFVVICLLWLLMLFSVIFLVVLSPRCVLKEKPHWWKSAIAYNIWVPSFQDSDGDGEGDVQGLISRLDQLRKSGVQTVWPSPFILSDDLGSAVRNYEQMESRIGQNQQADQLIKQLHDREMRIVLTVPIATTSTEHAWFLASAAASKPENKNYSLFYHWSSRGEDTAFYSPRPPLFYLHEMGNPRAAVLNWKHNAVRLHMFDVLSSWIDRGIDVFYLSGIEYLARTPNGTAPDWPAISDVIRDIRDHVDTYTEESVALKGKNKKVALFASREEAKEKDKKVLAAGGLDSIINYELGRVQKDTDICHRTEGTVATCVHEILSDILLFHSLNPQVWPQWEFGSPSLSRVATRVGSRAQAELLSMLQLVLPGTNNVYYGEELGMRDLANDTKVPAERGAMQWDDSTSAGFSSKRDGPVPVNSDFVNINWKRQYSQELSPLKMFLKLAKLRQREETLEAGKTLVGRLVDGAFTMTRFMQDENKFTQGYVYVAALNFSPHPVSLPLADLPNHSKLVKSQVVTVTSNVVSLLPRQFIDLSAKSIQLAPEEGVVFRYMAA